ncbi:MAG: hypothetical protein EOM69_11630, partial [Clostridia bacterium]|nr:hypothetical protein [Clostridia bacterium]
SMGIYQAYLCTAVALLALRGLQLLLLSQSKDKALIQKMLRYAAGLLLALVLYLLINKALLALSGAQAAQYMGMSEMGKINPRLIPHLIKTCYLQFFGFLFTDMEQVVPGAMGVVNGLLLAFIVVAMSALPFFGKKRTRLQNACVALIFLALPLLLNSVYMMNAESTHMLMRYSMAFFYVLAGMLMELLPTLALSRPRAAARGASLAAAALVFLSGFSFTVYSNQLYFMLNTSYEGATEYASRVLYRLETAEGYDATEPVLFVGYVGTTDYGHLPDYFSHIRGSGISTHPYGVLVTDSHWKAFLRSYLGMPLLSPTDEQSALLRQSDAVKNMPRYPSDGCVQKLDGVWVVKLADE